MGHADSVELSATPFFPQTDYQCGPAALATMLVASGVATSPDELVDDVYLPGRRGSLATEMVAATRVHGRIPYVLDPSPDAVLAELAAGHPVLVLQKLGAGPWPGWHYAVVVGHERDSRELLLRSGQQRRLAMSVQKFAATWDRGGRFAMVTLEPGRLPATAEPGRYMEAAAGLEAKGKLPEARMAYGAAASRWPQEVLPRLGLANVDAAAGKLELAEQGYREVLRLDPGNVAARNNLADVLLRLGCPESAAVEVAAARRLAANGPLASSVEATAARIAAEAGRDAATCRAR